MNKEEAIIQLHELNIDWEENGLDTKLNQTDINAIGTVISELYIANKKLDEIEGYVKLRNDELNDFKKSTINDLFNVNIEKFIKDILSIIGGE